MFPELGCVFHDMFVRRVCIVSVRGGVCCVRGSMCSVWGKFCGSEACIL